MRTLRSWLGAGALLLVPAMLAMAGDGYGARQYYSSWVASPHSSYYYRTYYYKPTPTYQAYHHQYVVYTPSHPNYAYYYNPYKKVYWGRCPLSYGDHGDNLVYSELAEGDRRENLADIPERAFPKPSQSLPVIPESKDKATLDLPPDDVPPNAKGIPTGATGALPSELPAS